MSAPVILLFTDQTANASSQEIQLPISQKGPHQAVRDYHYVMFGTWDTATMVVEVSVDGGTTWVVVASKTADAQAVVPLGPCIMRFTLSSVGAGTSLTASFNG